MSGHLTSFAGAKPIPRLQLELSPAELPGKWETLDSNVLLTILPVSSLLAPSLWARPTGRTCVPESPPCVSHRHVATPDLAGPQGTALTLPRSSRGRVTAWKA